MNRLQFLFLSICVALVPFAISRERMIEVWFVRNGFEVIRDTYTMADGTKLFRVKVLLTDTCHGVMISTPHENYPIEGAFQWMKDHEFKLETTQMMGTLDVDPKTGMWVMKKTDALRTFVSFTPPIWA